MRVNCNISAIIANNYLGKGQKAANNAIERLSSGLKINHAEDDAAGLAIAKKMHTQIKALKKANENGSAGVSVVQTAESALNELESMLQRARELAVQAGSDAYSGEDKDAIREELKKINDEIDRISTDTEYNTMPLLDGTLSRRVYPDVDGVDVISTTSGVLAKKYEISLAAPATQASLTCTDFAGTVTEQQAGFMKINDALIEIAEGDTFDDVYAKLHEGCLRANVAMDGTATPITFTNQNYGSAEELVIKFSNPDTAALFGLAEEQTVVGTDCEINLGAGFSSTAKATAEGQWVTIKDINNFEMKIEITDEMPVGTPCNLNVTDIGTMGIQIGANQGQQLIIDIPKINSHVLGMDQVNLGTSKCATESITKIDKAIELVSSARTNLGAYQNRLESSISSLEAYEENITSALSSVEDCDMAEEMTEYTARNVVSQAATSVLAQANERPQTVLQLLQ